MADGIPADASGDMNMTEHAHAASLKDAVLARASKPGKSGSKVVAVRVAAPLYAKLQEAATQAGVKPADLVRAAIEEFTKE
jgi:hypothetical protein